MRTLLVVIDDPPAKARRNSEPVSKAGKWTHSYFSDRQRPSMKTLPIHRRRPSMLLRTSASRRTLVKAKLPKQI